MSDCTAATSAITAVPALTSATTSSAGGRMAIVQASTKSIWTPKMMAANGSRCPGPEVCAPSTRPTPSSAAKPATVSASGRRTGTGGISSSGASSDSSSARRPGPPFRSRRGPFRSGRSPSSSAGPVRGAGG